MTRPSASSPSERPRLPDRRRDVLLLHEEQLARYGGGAGVRDPGALDSAVAMPRATFGGEFVHEDLFAMAAAYAFHIAQNQPFVDGNKRTGFAAALVTAMIEIAEKRIEKDGLAALLRELAR